MTKPTWDQFVAICAAAGARPWGPWFLVGDGVRLACVVEGTREDDRAAVLEAAAAMGLALPEPDGFVPLGSTGRYVVLFPPEGFADGQVAAALDWMEADRRARA